MDKNELMRQAIKLSAASNREDGDGPFGAIVVKDGKVVGEGRNCVGSTCDATAHSEVVAIRDAGSRLGTADLSGCEMYTSCEPCAMCSAAIWWAGIDRVYFAASSAQSGDAGFGTGTLMQELTRPIEERAVSGEKLLGDEAVAVLKKWMEGT
ncbi:MAG: nucleoside deaminase [Rhodospirillales bacterium]|nr:nucleoside deaminase [Rhodospirillales bacterium]